MAVPAGDDAIVNEWFAFARTDEVEPGTMYPFRLLGQRYVLARGLDGSLLATRDTCPHRGAQLSMGTFADGCLTCPYHGWEYDLSGRCTSQPAQPGRTPPANLRLASFPVEARYGLYWVCVGPEPRELPRYPQWDVRPDRNILLGPAVLRSCGPRIVENFLDMAHFPFVHAGYLGQLPHTEVQTYRVDVVDGELRATGCLFWQPNPGPLASSGGDVAYTYYVSTPYAAALDKLPSDADGGAEGAFSLLMIATPEDEFTCRSWMITSAYGTDLPLDDFLAFNKVIFEQDIPIVESQQPARLPMDLKAEWHQPADRSALAYRRWLRARGVRYGTSLNDGPAAAPPRQTGPPPSSWR